MVSLEDIDQQIADVQKVLLQKRQQLADFENAIESLEQPVAANIGASPTQTMIEIIGNATTEEQRVQRLQVARNAAEKHREEVAAFEKELLTLQKQRDATEKQIEWEEKYQPHCDRLRKLWKRPPEIEQKILKNIAQMETHRKNIAQLKKRLDEWTPEKQQQVEQSTGHKVNKNYAHELKSQIKISEDKFDAAFKKIKDIENNEEQQLFRVFVHDEVDKELALEAIKPQIQKLQRLNRHYCKLASDLQARIEEHLAIRYIKIQVPQLPEEFNHEFGN